MDIEGTVTITIKDFKELEKKIIALERDNERMNNIIKSPEVVKAMHLDE